MKIILKMLLVVALSFGLLHGYLAYTAMNDILRCAGIPMVQGGTRTEWKFYSQECRLVGFNGEKTNDFLFRTE